MKFQQLMLLLSFSQNYSFTLLLVAHVQYLRSCDANNAFVFQKILAEMDEVEFGRHVKALAALILEKPKKLASESAKYWLEIATRQYNFERRELPWEQLNFDKRIGVLNVAAVNSSLRNTG